MSKENLYEERTRAKENWLFWQRQIGSLEFCSDKEFGKRILENSKEAYKKLTEIEEKIRERRK